MKNGCAKNGGACPAACYILLQSINICYRQGRVFAVSYKNIYLCKDMYGCICVLQQIICIMMHHVLLDEMGLTGFDSRSEWYVSMRSLVCRLLNISSQKFIWRKQVRSRCLIEVQ